MKIVRIHNRVLRRKLVTEAAVNGMGLGYIPPYVRVTVGEIGHRADGEYHYDLEMSPEEALDLGARLISAGKQLTGQGVIESSGQLICPGDAVQVVGWDATAGTSRTRVGCRGKVVSVGRERVEVQLDEFVGTDRIHPRTLRKLPSSS